MYENKQFLVFIHEKIKTGQKPFQPLLGEKLWEVDRYSPPARAHQHHNYSVCWQVGSNRLQILMMDPHIMKRAPDPGRKTTESELPCLWTVRRAVTGCTWSKTPFKFGKLIRKLHVFAIWGGIWHQKATLEMMLHICYETRKGDRNVWSIQLPGMCVCHIAEILSPNGHFKAHYFNTLRLVLRDNHKAWTHFFRNCLGVRQHPRANANRLKEQCDFFFFLLF